MTSATTTARAAAAALACATLTACTSGGGDATTSTTATTTTAVATGTQTAGGRPSPTIEGRLFGDEAHCLGPANCYLGNPRKLPEPQVAAWLGTLSGAKAAPPGSGPWPFVVLDAPGDGREVRSAPRADAPVDAAEGKALQHRIVYAFCRVPDGPAPDGRGGVGGWLRIQSLQDAAAGDYYMDGSHLHPFHHDGRITPCR